MKLRTSFCKPVALKKDIFRYAPIWALYLIGMMLVLLDVGGYRYYDQFARSSMDDMIKAFGVVNICYAGLVAVSLFGDLYNTKMCYSLHAMPVRRESWLLTHLLTGLLFSLVPNAIATLYLMTQLEKYWFLALYWLLAVTLQYLFFFGLGTVSALLTGSRFAMLAVYAGFNFVAMLLYATIRTIYLPMLTGVVANIDPFQQFSPVVKLYDFKYFTFSNKEILQVGEWGSDTRTFYVYEGLADGWGYTAIIGVVGLAAMAVSVWLYRIRHLESAGDFVAFPRIKAVACIVITMCVALCCGLLGEAMGSGYIIWLAVGLIVGFFGSLMLLERRVKVFRKKTFLGFGILAFVVALSVVATECDWIGIETWTPRAGRVESVTVSNYYRGNGYYDIGYESQLSATVTDPAEIEELIQAHEDILDRLDENAMTKHRVVLTYKLKSGVTVTRSYFAPANGENYRIIYKYLYKPENILGFDHWENIAGSIRRMYTDNGEVPAELHGALLQALQIDCHAGNVINEGKSEHYIEYGFDDAAGNYIWRTLWILDTAENTLKLLKGPQMAMGYSDWASFLPSVSNLTCNGWEVPESDKEALLTAIRQDIEAGTLKMYQYDGDGVVVFYSVPQPDGEWIYREFYINVENINTWAIVAENYV